MKIFHRDFKAISFNPKSGALVIAFHLNKHKNKLLVCLSPVRWLCPCCRYSIIPKHDLHGGPRGGREVGAKEHPKIRNADEKGFRY